MNPKIKKITFLLLKLVVAAGLLGWVLSSTWNDYVQTRQAPASWIDRALNHQNSLSLAAPKPVATAGGMAYNVTHGMWWWKKPSQARIADLEPIKDKDGKVVLTDGQEQYVRPGFLSSIRTLDGWYLVVALCGFLASVLVVATRWWFLLRIQEIYISWWETIRLTFLGNFFNIVMPSTVGGDLVKAYYISKHTHKTPAVLVSMFVDRVLGLTELTLLAGVMVVIVLASRADTYEHIHLSVITVLVVICIVIVAMTFLLSARFRRLFHLQAIYQKTSIAHHIAAAGDAAKLYRQRLPALLKAIGITFGAHVLWVGSIAMVGMSMPDMRMATPWYSYFLYIPLIYIIGAVPITPGGAGVVEGLYMVFFAAVNPSIVLAMALLARFVPMVWTLPGVVVAVTGPRLPKAAQMQAELDAQEEARQ